LQILLGGYQSKLTPVARFRKGSLELVMDERLTQPLLRIGGKRAEKAYEILAKRFLTRREGDREVLIPLTGFPAVSVWLLASYTAEPSEELLDELLYRTPKVLADLVWDLVELGASLEPDKPLIKHELAVRASKVLRELLNLYKFEC